MQIKDFSYVVNDVKRNILFGNLYNAGKSMLVEKFIVKNAFVN